MNRFYSEDGRKNRYFVSMKDEPNDESSLTEWWEVSKKEFENMEQTFIDVARYFGKFYSYRSNKHIMDVYKL